MKQTLFISIIALSLAPIYGATSQTFSISKNTNLVIEKGDITKCPVESIVNAANEQLLGGAGVCGAIFNSAGWDKLQKACDKYTENNNVRCPVGKACITDSFNLKSLGIKHIIHAVGPDCRIIKDTKQQDFLLEQSYKNSLILADKNNITSIAFPFISSAIYAFPKKRASNIVLKTVVNYIKNNNTKINSVYFVLFSQEDFDLFCCESKNII